VADVGEEYLMYGLPAGAAIQGVTEDGPAQKAGLQKGDIVTKIDGKEITGANDLVDTVALHEVGDKLMLTVYRAGQTLEVTVEVGEQIQSATQQEQTQKPSTGLDGWGQWPF